MYLTIRVDQNVSVSVMRDGEHERFMFGKGVHEIDEDIAAEIEAMGLRWTRVTITPPADAVTGQADTTPLSKDALELGSEGAEAKSFKEIFEAREAAAKALADAEKTLPDPAPDFPCGECADEFPTVAALERHVEMNHVPEPVLVDPDDPGQGEVVPDEPVATRVRTKGDGLGKFVKGDITAPAAE